MPFWQAINMSDKAIDFGDLRSVIESEVWKGDESLTKWVLCEYARLCSSGVSPPAGFPSQSAIFNQIPAATSSRGVRTESLVPYSDTESEEEEEEYQTGGRVAIPASTSIQTLPEVTKSAFDAREEEEALSPPHSPASSQPNSLPQPSSTVSIDSEGLQVDNFFHFGTSEERRVKKFGVTGERFPVHFRDLEKVADIDDVLLQLFGRILERAFSEGGDSDIIGVEIIHPSLTDGSFLVPFAHRKDLTAEKLLALVEKLAQSRKELAFDSDLSVGITRVHLPSGGSRLEKSRRLNFQKWFALKNKGGGRTFIQIQNTDNLCLARAVVVAKARVEKDTNPEVRWERIRKGDYHRDYLQRNLARQLMMDSGLGNHHGECGIEEMRKIQAFLSPEYQLKIFSRSVCDDLIFVGDVDDAENAIKLYLYHHDNHYSVITSVPGFLDVQYWCDRCHKGYTNKDRHKCNRKCFDCKKVGINHRPRVIRNDDVVECGDCNRVFYTQECYDRHLEKIQPKSSGQGNKRRKIAVKSTCETFRRCTTCLKTIDTRKPNHLCGYYFCGRCGSKEKEGDEHHCYIQPITLKKKKKKSQEEEEEAGNPDDIDSLVRERERGERGLDCDDFELLQTLESLYNPAEEGDSDDDDDNGEIRHLKAQLKALTAPPPGEESSSATPSIPIQFEDEWCYIFWDFETRQDRQVGRNQFAPIYAHDPVYAVAVKVCNTCVERVLDDEDGFCITCGNNWYTFVGDNCKQEFCAWLFDEENAGVTAIAHNARGFDTHFLLQYLVAQGIKPVTINRGREILLLAVKSCKIKVIDSLSFLPMGLAQFPKTFGLMEKKKGYFPHLFTCVENWNYVGEWPDAWIYSPANMTSEKREDFYRWYHQQSGKIFNFQKEMKEYCKSDVDILMRGGLTFENSFWKATGVRPFQVSCTIASACNYVFRLKFLKPKSIGVIPPGGYLRKWQQSRIAIKWMMWESQFSGIAIQHANNIGEKKVTIKSAGKEYLVDGYAEINGKCRIYEFHGCVWHGCISCFPQRGKKVPGSHHTLEDAYHRTINKVKAFRRAGYEVVEMWECQLEKEMVENPEMADFINSVTIIEPLNPKDGFFGGRTNVIKLKHVCQPGEKIRYIDIVSLYPWVNKWTKYPVGHPVILWNGFEKVTKDNKPYFGMIKCKILPPRQLFHPILPARIDNKLKFILCQACATENNYDFCNHSDEERALVGTWVTLEVDKAVDMGYEVMETYMVYHYEKFDQHDGVDENTGLFTKYINFFMKGKVEATGWPSGVETDEEKKAYADLYMEKEGIKLDSGEMDKNPGKRAVSKISLNSFWGKFGQRANMPRGEFFTSGADFLERCTDPTLSLISILELGGENSEMLHASFRKEEEFVDVMPNTNVVIAAFTTASARLKLYSYLEKLGKRVLYFDTDSIIYITTEGREEYTPHIGDFLGDMSDELAEYGDEAYIDRFVGAGPKNYGIRVRKRNGDTISKVKIRGFTASYAMSRHLNFESLEKKVTSFVKDDIIDTTNIVRQNIRRTANSDVITVTQSKTYRVVCDKRVVHSDYTTRPFGTCEFP